MTRWLLCDYGQVLSTAPPVDEWHRLHSLAAPDLPPDLFEKAYWEHRPPYDRGDLDPGEFWRRVTGREPTSRQLEALSDLDSAIWLHPDEASVDAARQAAQSANLRPAILSNAPRLVAAAIDRLEWLEPFERRFYSWDLKAVKPEPRAYEQVLGLLGAPPGDVVFIDDRPANVEAARRLGLRALHFTGPETFGAV